MGFESSEMARWRLASLVSADDTLGHLVCDALSEPADVKPADVPEPRTPLSALDILGRDALDTPGIGANFLAAYAAQTRAIRLVWELQQRGGAALPADVVAALRQAMRAAESVWH